MHKPPGTARQGALIGMDDLNFDAWRRAIKADVSFNYHLEMAIALERINDFSPALDHYRLALDVMPGDVEVMGRRVRLLRQTGRTAEAQAEDDRANRVAPDYWINALFLISIRHLLNTETSLAQAVFSEALAVGAPPSWQQQATAIALQVMQDGDFATPNVAFMPLENDAELKMAAYFSDALIKLGNIANESGRIEAAAAAITAAVQLSPSPLSGPAMLIAGRCRFQVGHMAQAAKDLAVAVERGERNATALVSLGMALVHLGRWNEGQSRLREAVSLNPQEIGSRFSLGIALLYSGGVEEALTILDEAAAIDPENGWTYLFQVSAHLEGNDVQAAREALNRARSASVHGAWIAYYDAAILLHAGQPAEALVMLEQGTRNWHESSPSQAGLFPLLRGGIMRAIGANDQAVALLTESCKLTRNLPWPRISLMSCLLDLGNDLEAEAILSDLKLDYNGHPWVSLMQGRLAESRGHDTVAKQHFAKALADGASTALANFYMGGKPLAATILAKASQSSIL